METRNWILEQLNYNTSDDKSLPFLILATMGYLKKMKSKKALINYNKAFNWEYNHVRHLPAISKQEFYNGGHSSRY
jgi:energy-converting hydrogenase Eha subunit G